jgi:two-component system OmpR family sensor kinase
VSRLGSLTGQLSLRARLVAVVLLLLSVALVLSAAATLTVLRGELMNRVDAELRAASEPGNLRELFDAHMPGPGGPGGPSPYAVTFLDADGDVLERWSGSRAQHDTPSLSLTSEEVQKLDGEPFTVSSTDGAGPRWRVVARPVILTDRTTGAQTPITAAVAQPLDGVQETLSQMRGRLLIFGVLVLAACALLGLVAVRRAFRPLRQVEDVATAFGQGDTSRRVHVNAPGTEVGRLGGSINAMLDSIETTLAAREASEARMRRFVADASHELRTPVASVRGFAELYRQGAVTNPDDVARSFRRIEDEAARMGGLVEDLLQLARLDEQRPMRRDPVDLLVLAGDAVHDAQALAPGRWVRLVGLDGAPSPASAPAMGDDARLRQVLTNLLTNALRHTPSDTPVEIGVGVRDGWAVWQVVDHGPGIRAEDAQRIFERFYRADTSRSRASGGGSGLGLAIVDAICRAHGGAARVVPTPGGGATFEVAIPAARPEADNRDVQGTPRSDGGPVQPAPVSWTAGR